MKFPSLLGALLLAGALTPLTTVSTASAAPGDCTDDLVANSTVDLDDATPARWDVQADGAIGDGALLDEVGDVDRFDAFDGYPVLAIDDGTNGGERYEGTAGTCTYELDGRQVAFPVETTLGGLELSRKVYVPATGTGFARLYNEVHNPGVDPVTISVFTSHEGDLGSDSDTELQDSSAGPQVGFVDDALDTYVSWFVTSDQEIAADADPVVAHSLDGSLASAGVHDRVDSVRLIGAGDLLSFEYQDVTVPAGGTVAYVSFAAMRATIGEAASAARYLDDQPAAAFEGLTTAEQAAVQNWAPVDVDADGVPNGTDNCRDIANPSQADLDLDGRGDVCDADIDGDGIANDVETAFGTNPAKADTDSDGVRDNADNCPKTAGAGADGCPVPSVVGDNVRGKSALKLTASTSKSGPVKINSKGIVRATGTPGARDCLNGKAQVVVKVGKLAVFHRIVSVKNTCSFRAKVRLDQPRDLVRKVKVKGFFLGSDGLLPSKDSVKLS